MVTNKDAKDVEKAVVAAPVVLSEGAGVALGSVFNRLLKSKGGARGSRVTGKKRPRSEKGPVVLKENEDAQKSLAEEKKDRKEYKESKKAKLKFENNALVIPDAATNAALEKELLATATKGAVALFNAVSKAQKLNDEVSTGKAKKKGPPVSRESFMDMMRAGVNKEAKPTEDNDASEHYPSDEDAGRAKKPGAKWLKNDFLTAGSRKLKDWDREAPAGEESSSSDDESSDDEDLGLSDSDSE